MPKPNRKKGQKSSEAQRVEVPREPEPIPEEPQVQEEDGATSSKRLMRKEKKQAKQEMARQAAVALGQLAPGRQKSEPTVEVPQSAPEPTPAPIPEPVPAPAPIQEPKMKVEVTEELEGLGLGSSRKRRPRKKKTDGSSTSQSVTAQAAQPVADPSSQPFTGLSSQPVAGPSSQPVAGPSSQPVATVCQPGGDGTQVVTAPVTGPAKTLMQMNPSPSFPWPQPAPIAQSSAPLGAWGRGRGRSPAIPIIPTSHSTPRFAQSFPVPISQPQTTTPPQNTSRPQITTPAQSTYRSQTISPAQSTSRPQTISPAQSTSGPQTISPAQSTSGPQTISQAQSTSRPQSTSQIKTICRYRIPSKIPGRFVGGKPITVLTNYLEMTFKTLTISRYDVSFTPDRPKKLIPLVFKKIKEKYFPRELIAFDQSKNCYSLRPLPNVPQNDRFLTAIEIQDTNGKDMRFEVAIKPTGLIDLSKIKRYMTEGTTCLNTPTEEIQCIDVILRQGTLESYVKAGRQFFRRPRDPVDLGHGYEMWTGLFQSAIFTSKAFVNIDVAHKGFPRHQPLINAITRDFNLDLKLPANRQRPYDVELFLNFLRGLKVTATILGGNSQNVTKREYICVGIVDPPGKQKFVLNEQDGKQRNITVGEYYATEKHYQIKYPQFNCIWVGSKQKTIFFPAELLEVTYGQPLARQLNETQVSRMVREAATPPDQRMRKITEVISSMQYSTNKDFKQFGMDISDKFYEVKAKILEPPLLDIGRGTAMPRKGQWQAPQLLKPESLLNWGFIAVECGQGTDYNGVIDTIMNAGKQMGMKISQPTIARFDVTMNSLQRMLTDIADQGIINFMFVVISTRGRDHYHLLKQMAESKIGMLTQCMKEATARRMSPMTAKNILLKVNSKLMGINHALGDKTMPRCLRDGGVMIVGADVTHPSPDQENVPSIAAVTASIDAKCYMYNIELSVQTPKKEMIVEFADMMYDHLKVYQQRNMNQLPRKIFVFRDGVSEGQFAEVMNSELAAVHAAYARIAGPTKKAEILFLLVQKRHHTRFFNKGQYCQYNVEPGTVVDTDIVHASELDFYLVSHQAIKGTARPTRYHAVCNDGKIPDDEVEQLTFYLCHLYSRCSRSVSYPTPTYYAHLACLRARSLTYGKQFHNKELNDRPQRIRVLDKMLQRSRMFFV